MCIAMSSVRSSSIGPVTVNVNVPSDTDSSFVNTAGSSYGLVCDALCPRLCQQVRESSPRTNSSEISPFAEKQYVTITVTYNDNDSYLEVTDALLTWGKWTDFNDCSTEIPSPNRFRITKDQPAKIRACGRANSSSGTEGSFYLQSNINGVSSLDAKVYFDVPWGIGSDKFELTNLKPGNPTVLCVGDTKRAINKTINCYKL